MPSENDEINNYKMDQHSTSIFPLKTQMLSWIGIALDLDKNSENHLIRMKYFLNFLQILPTK